MNLLCLIWLTEALGENPDILKKAVDSALAYNTMPERCLAYRKCINFEIGKCIMKKLDPTIILYDKSDKTRVMYNAISEPRN